MILDLPAYILAGGRSSRFGSDKARADLDGNAMIARLYASLRSVAAEPVVVAECRDKYADLGLTTIADDAPGLGPLGGLLTALNHRRARGGEGWLLLSACDWAEFHLRWVEKLWRSTQAAHDAVAFRDHAVWQPMLALYHTRIVPEVEVCLRSPIRRMTALLDRIAARAVDPPADWSMLLQINTQKDRDRYLLERTLAGKGPSRMR